MAENNFQGTIESLMNGLNGFASTKTVVGEPIYLGETIILPLVDISFGMGAGSFRGEKQSNQGGGLGGKVSPSAVLILQNGTSKMVSVKNQDSLMKLVDMIPDYVDKFIKMAQEKKDPEGFAAREAAKAAAAEDMKEKLEDAVN